MSNYLIIAASSAIGTALARLLVEQGNKVFLTSRNIEKISSLAEELKAPYSALDAADFTATDSIFTVAKEKLGKLDGVVNCAGSLMLKPAHNTTQEQFLSVMTASLTTAFSTVHAAGKHLNQGGSVVLISSAAAIQGIPNHEAIAAAKAGIIGLIRSAAASYASNQLRFNAVAPGLTETPMTAHLISTPAFRKVSEGMHALHRLGNPMDIARAIAFFLDENNSWITGQILAVDGGLSCIRPKEHL